jgi:hypothetical protein
LTLAGAVVEPARRPAVLRTRRRPLNPTTTVDPLVSGHTNAALIALARRRSDVTYAMLSDNKP